ncbi:MAG: right-handed parallel beta-helix repeat-containing protein [Verrucomicrobia bacterium]|nr:right-handed parallel beta-helix repeat-containing protein [Verrucomicrobiota bacterium]
MKTLAQIEPRAPISTLPFSVTVPGSYYLTTNLTGARGTNGVVIQADDVTVDLNGFSLIGSPGALNGITVSDARRNVRISNGSIRNWTVGIEATNSAQSSLELLVVSENLGHGILLGPNSVVMKCTSYSNQGDGINADREATVKDCTARGNFLNGIKLGTGSEVRACLASFNSEHGIAVEKYCVVSDCTVLSNTRVGLAAGEGCQISAVSASHNREVGIVLGANSVVNNSFATLNSWSGLVGGDSCRITETSTTFNGQNGIASGAESQMNNCVASQNQDHGLVAGAGSHVLQSKANGNRKVGIRAENGSTVQGCTSQRNGADGILVSSDCTVAANHCTYNFNARDAAGIHATGTDNCIKENHVVSNDRGLSVEIAGNIIFKNTAANNTINYLILGSQTIGPVVKGTAPIEVTNPWTNFEF